MADMNAERKRRAGLRDTGRCACGRYRVQCRDGCLDEDDYVQPFTIPVAELLRMVVRRREDLRQNSARPEQECAKHSLTRREEET